MTVQDKLARIDKQMDRLQFLINRDEARLTKFEDRVYERTMRRSARMSEYKRKRDLICPPPPAKPGLTLAKADAIITKHYLATLKAQLSSPHLGLQNLSKKGKRDV